MGFVCITDDKVNGLLIGASKSIFAKDILQSIRFSNDRAASMNQTLIIVCGS